MGKLTLPLRGGAGAASASGGHWTGPTKSSRAPLEFLPDGAIEGKPPDGQVPGARGLFHILTAWPPAKSMENLAKKVIHPSEKVPGARACRASRASVRAVRRVRGALQEGAGHMAGLTGVARVVRVGSLVVVGRRHKYFTQHGRGPS